VPTGRRCSRIDDRAILNAILFVLLKGIPWSDLPDRYSPHTTAYNRFKRSAARGISGRMFEALAAGSRDSLQLIDGTIVKTTVGRPAQRGERTQAIGISRSGHSTKIHALIDGKGRPLHFALTGSRCMVTKSSASSCKRSGRPPLAVAADNANDSKRARLQIKDDGAVAVIPSRANARKMK
jgi:transposase